MAKSKKTKYPTGYKEHLTIREASDFWDKHSLFEFDDVEQVQVDFELKCEKHAILIDDEVARRIKSLARKRKQPQHKLVNELLVKSLSQYA
jgi:hypothetical protein